MTRNRADCLKKVCILSKSERISFQKAFDLRYIVMEVYLEDILERVIHEKLS